MPCRHTDDHRRLAHRDRAEPVPQDDLAGAVTTAGRPLEGREGGEGERSMRLIVKRGDFPAPRPVRPDPSEEHHHSAELVAPELSHRRCEREWGAGQSDAHG
ncbi:MAG TPA: hypothetical protein VEH28_06015 [Thermoplasmata archaeon]|nr:hypothetical protein [Thermoplasmata archaeon]